jgi:RNase P subunit RPR2
MPQRQESIDFLSTTNTQEKKSEKKQPVMDTRQSNQHTIPCPRCQGLMSPEWCVNLNYDAGEMEILTWRCLQCGELIDPVILENRKNPLPSPNRKQARHLPSSLGEAQKTKPKEVKRERLTNTRTQ